MWGLVPINESGARMWVWVKFLWNLNTRGANVNEIFLYASIVVDTIWRARNDKVHSNNLNTIQHYIDSIKHCYADYVLFILPTPAVTTEIGWSPPLKDWIKINCDVRNGRETMCMAVVARDHVGSFVWIAVNNVSFSDSLIGEAAACLLALEISVALGYNFVFIENDS
ncbi:hypothetical protein CsatB_022787 [Cannabis sativa]